MVRDALARTVQKTAAKKKAALKSAKKPKAKKAKKVSWLAFSACVRQAPWSARRRLSLVGQVWSWDGDCSMDRGEKSNT